MKITVTQLFDNPPSAELLAGNGGGKFYMLLDDLPSDLKVGEELILCRPKSDEPEPSQQEPDEPRDG